MKPTANADVKKDPITFATLWRASKYKNEGTFCKALSNAGADELDAYDFYISGETRKILDISMRDLEALQELTGADTHALYMRAVVAYQLAKVGPGTLKLLRSRFKPTTVKSWLDQHSMPSEKTLTILREEFDIDALANSIITTKQKETEAENMGAPVAVPAVKPAKQSKKAGKAAVHVVKKATVKPVHYTLANLWSEHHPDIATYCDTTFGGQGSALYTRLAKGDASAVTEFTYDMMEAMYDKHPLQDTQLLYWRALVNHNIKQLSPSKFARVQELYGISEVTNWENGVEAPDEDQLEEMAGFGVYLLEHSVFDDDAQFQPPKKSDGRAFAADDEVFEHFLSRDLERVTHLSQDFAKISDAGYNDRDYAELAQSSAFRAMLELWPTTFRHGCEEDNDNEPRWWTLQTPVFDARVCEERAEITVEHEEGNFTLRAKARDLPHAVSLVFRYFDVLSSDQLSEVLSDIGFDSDHVAGVQFELTVKSHYTPTAFFDAEYRNEIRISGNDHIMPAAQFLQLAAQTVRGVVFGVGNTMDRYETYDVLVGTSTVHALYMNNRASDDAQKGPRKGAASAAEHEVFLTQDAEYMHGHGVYVEGNVMHLPLSEDAREAFHYSSVEPTHNYMTEITFI